jgi:hypothetical protein
MEMRYTRLILRNTLSILAVIAALIAAIAAIGGSFMSILLTSSCPNNQILCMAWTYILFMLLVLGGVLLFVFAIPIVADLIIAFIKWVRKIVSIYLSKPFNVFCEIERRGNEVYIKVKNKEWFIDAVHIYVHCNFMHDLTVFQDPIKWNTAYDNNGETYILRRQEKILNFATVDEDKKEFNIHLLDRDLKLPFGHIVGDAVFEFWVGGFSSASSTRPSKNIINHRFTILETFKNEEIKFEIGVQW